MKTPEEIKNGLECCIPCEDPECLDCPYRRVEACADTRIDDTLAYIQQLEVERDELLQKNQQLERERDAAVEDLQTGVCCETCAHYNTDAKEPPCATCRDAYAHGNWEWRGVPQEVSNG